MTIFHISCIMNLLLFMLTGYISSLHMTLDRDSSNLQPNWLAEALELQGTNWNLSF